MTKIRRGHMVRVINNGGLSNSDDAYAIHHFFPIGTIATVLEEDNGRGNLKLRGHDGDGIFYSQNVSREDVEIYIPHSPSKKKEPKPTNLKTADDVIISGVTFEQAIKDDILLMAHLYHKGLSFRDVAKLTNVHERTVRRRFKRYGIPSRAPKGVK